ncbi:hypothetical protein AAV99_03480 [Aurantiacibacter marinus]|uniref:Macrocin-O-methyltransferase n=2 Tax=Aurantiacibacter marinus TaxID=874156 RepID=A0A0H0XT77_9SPHN|nr:hypothetical protein AAV99_03480 [Aurantiacibacter marinus]
MAEYASAQGRSFHGFDVFEMIPPPTSEKDGEKAHQRYEAIRDGKSKGIGEDTYYGYLDNLYDRVVTSFKDHNLAVDGTKIVLHKGLFEETLPRAQIGQIALAHIDCDWYDPVRYCLDNVAGHMSTGALFLIDDYHDFGGARIAVDEFLQERDDFMMEPGPNPYLIKL